MQVKLGLDEYKNQACSSKLLTNYCELYADLDTPVSIYAKLQKKSPDAFLFESVIGGERIGRYSFIGFRPLDLVQVESGSPIDPYEYLEQRILELTTSADSDLLPFFHKGFVGFFSFESVAKIETSLELQESKFPEMYMLLVGSMVVFDHVKQKLYLLVNSIFDGTVSLEVLYEQSIRDLQEIKSLITEEHELVRLNPDVDLRVVETLIGTGFDSNTGAQEYARIVAKAKEHIREGDIFQVVASHKLSANLSVDPLSAYRTLRSLNPSPYLFIFNAKQGVNFTLVGSSPEMLVKADYKYDANGNRYLEAENRPIAGTYRRGKNEEADKLLVERLLQDKKEIAEHVMLIDLARNDLGRVCTSGSITVPEKMVVEKYSHVLHIVSSVTGKISEKFGVSSGIRLLRASFPAGTLSGAPKVEAMQIIAKLEKAARGPYGGAIGYFGLDGSVDTAILIRTLLIEPGKVSIQAGGGIVADSSPELEWLETLNKASALIRVVEACSDRTV